MPDNEQETPEAQPEVAQQLFTPREHSPEVLELARQIQEADGTLSAVPPSQAAQEAAQRLKDAPEPGTRVKFTPAAHNAKTVAMARRLRGA
jgi:hypothetical protein